MAKKRIVTLAELKEAAANAMKSGSSDTRPISERRVIGKNKNKYEKMKKRVRELLEG